MGISHLCPPTPLLSLQEALSVSTLPWGNFHRSIYRHAPLPSSRLSQPPPTPRARPPESCTPPHLQRGSRPGRSGPSPSPSSPRWNRKRFRSPCGGTNKSMELTRRKSAAGKQAASARNTGPRCAAGAKRPQTLGVGTSRTCSRTCRFTDGAITTPASKPPLPSRQTRPRQRTNEKRKKKKQKRKDLYPSFGPPPPQSALKPPQPGQKTPPHFQPGLLA